MKDNRKIFLAPVSSSELYKNYQKTVMVGFEKNDFIKNITASKYIKLLSQANIIRLWGVKNVKLTSFNKSSIGDVILFYHKGFIVGKADIEFKDNNIELSNQLWGYDFNKLRNTKEYWENILFLGNYSIINIPLKVLIDYAEYSPLMSVRSFIEYSPIGLSKIIKEHESIDSFLNMHK